MDVVCKQVDVLESKFDNEIHMRERSAMKTSCMERVRARLHTRRLFVFVRSMRTNFWASCKLSFNVSTRCCKICRLPHLTSPHLCSCLFFKWMCAVLVSRYCRCLASRHR